jgi:hypothetical protein
MNQETISPRAGRQRGGYLRCPYGSKAITLIATRHTTRSLDPAARPWSVFRCGISEEES